MLLVVAVVVALPLGIVWTAGTFEGRFVRDLRVDLEAVATEVAAALVERRPVDPVAARHHVWLRVLGPDGALEQDHFHAEPSRWVAPISRPFFDVAGARGL